MKTQRINAYTVNGRVIYFKEENNSRTADWIAVGDVTEDLDSITIDVQLFNLRELRASLTEGKYVV